MATIPELTEHNTHNTAVSVDQDITSASPIVAPSSFPTLVEEHATRTAPWKDSAAFRALTSHDLVYIIARDLRTCDRRAAWLAIEEGRKAWAPLIWESTPAGMLSCSTFVETEELIREKAHLVASLFITEPPSGRTFGNPTLEYSTAEHHYATIQAIHRNSAVFTWLKVLCIRLTHDTSFHHLAKLLALPTLGHVRLYFQRRGSVPSLTRAWEALDVLQSLSVDIKHLHITFPTYEGWNVYREGYPTPPFFRATLSAILVRLTVLESLSLWNIPVEDGVFWPQLCALSYCGVPPNSLLARVERLELFLSTATYLTIEAMDAPLLAELSVSWKATPAHPFELHRICSVIDSKWGNTLRIFQLLVNRATHSHSCSPPKAREIIRRLRNCSLVRFSLLLQGDCGDDEVRLVYQQWPRLKELHMYTSTLFSLWTPQTPTATSLIETVQHLPELRALTLSIDFDRMPFNSLRRNDIALHTSQKIRDLTLVLCHATSVPTAAHLVRRICPRLKSLTVDNIHFHEWSCQFDQNVARSLNPTNLKPKRLVKALPAAHRSKAERRLEGEEWNMCC